MGMPGRDRARTATAATITIDTSAPLPVQGSSRTAAQVRPPSQHWTGTTGGQVAPPADGRVDLSAHDTPAQARVSRRAAAARSLRGPCLPLSSLCERCELPDALRANPDACMYASSHAGLATLARHSVPDAASPCYSMPTLRYCKETGRGRARAADGHFTRSVEGTGEDLRKAQSAKSAPTRAAARSAP